MKRIKALIQDWLGIAFLQDRIKYLEAENVQQAVELGKEATALLKEIQALRQENNQLAVRQRSLEKLINVGVDVSASPMNDMSWAVVCIPGKGTNVVKFFDLSPDMADDMLRTLKQFENYNLKVDAPLSFSRYFNKYKL